MKADWKGGKKKSVTVSYHKECGTLLSLPGKRWELGALFDLRKELLECIDLKMFKMDFPYGNTYRIALPDLLHFMLNNILISWRLQKKTDIWSCNTCIQWIVVHIALIVILYAKLFINLITEK